MKRTRLALIPSSVRIGAIRRTNASYSAIVTTNDRATTTNGVDSSLEGGHDDARKRLGFVALSLPRAAPPRAPSSLSSERTVHAAATPRTQVRPVADSDAIVTLGSPAGRATPSDGTSGLTVGYPNGGDPYW